MTDKHISNNDDEIEITYLSYWVPLHHKMISPVCQASPPHPPQVLSSIPQFSEAEISEYESTETINELLPDPDLM